jgi:hypothetical protein
MTLSRPLAAPGDDLGYLPGVSAVGGSCDPFFEESVSTTGGELKVYRCDWGWFVRNGTREARSRYLDEAFERVLGGPLDRRTIRALVEVLDGELTAERDRTGKTASREFRRRASA